MDGHTKKVIRLSHNLELRIEWLVMLKYPHSLIVKNVTKKQQIRAFGNSRKLNEKYIH